MGLVNRVLARNTFQSDWQESVRFVADGDALQGGIGFTRTGDIYEADGFGVMPAQDGVTPVVGNRFVLDFAAPDVDTGILEVVDVGSGGTTYKWRRAPGLTSAIDPSKPAGLTVRVEEGGVFEGLLVKIITTGSVTVNTDPMDFELDSAGGGGGFTSVAVKTDANDGETTAADVMYAIGGSADFGLRLPDTTDLPVGSLVNFLCLSEDARVDIETFTPAAPETITGEGNAPTAATYHLIGGSSERYMFEYQGDLGGGPLWAVTALTHSQAVPKKAHVDLATRAPLPAYTASGTGAAQILTGDANGELIIDGVQVSTSTPMKGGILVKDETAASGAANGIYQVIQVGVTGVSPFILRRRLDWWFNDQTALGAEVSVVPDEGSLGGTNDGKTFVTRPGLGVGGHVAAAFKSRSRVEDIYGDDWGQTTNAVTDVVLSIPTWANDTITKARVSVMGQDDTSNDRQDYEYIVLIKRDSGGTVTVDLVQEELKFEEQAPATPCVTFIINGNNIDVTVLGIATRIIEWRVQYEATRLPLGGG